MDKERAGYDQQPPPYDGIKGTCGNTNSEIPQHVNSQNYISNNGIPTNRLPVEGYGNFYINNGVPSSTVPPQGYGMNNPQNGVPNSTIPPQGYGMNNINNGMPNTTGFPQGYGQSNINNNTTVVVSQPSPCFVMGINRPADYTVSSVLACLFCFWPTGIFAIYFAIQANSLADVGDWPNARIMANRARSLVISSIILGIVALAVVPVIIVHAR